MKNNVMYILKNEKWVAVKNNTEVGAGKAKELQKRFNSVKPKKGRILTARIDDEGKGVITYRVGDKHTRKVF